MKPLSLESVGSFKSKLSKVSLNDRLPFFSIVSLGIPVNVPTDSGLMYASYPIFYKIKWRGDKYAMIQLCNGDVDSNHLINLTDPCNQIRCMWKPL